MLFRFKALGEDVPFDEGPPDYHRGTFTFNRGLLKGTGTTSTVYLEPAVHRTVMATGRTVTVRWQMAGSRCTVMVAPVPSRRPRLKGRRALRICSRDDGAELIRYVPYKVCFQLSAF
jgi:hypothetical protein